MPNKLCGLLGICKRAGALTVGFDAVCADMQNGNARLVLLAADAAEKTAKEIHFIAKTANCTVAVIALAKADIAAALGLQKPIAVLATADDGFAAAMKKYIPAELKEDTAL